MGHPEWLTDPRFSTTRERARHAEEMIAAFDETFMTKTVAEWGEIFDEHDVWWVPLQRDHHVVNDPQAVANGAYPELPPQMTQLVRLLPWALPPQVCASRLEREAALPSGERG